MITLDHGSGGKLSRELIEKVLIPHIGNPILEQLGDSAILEIKDTKLAFTTDSHTVSPIFFPGGDIGKLSITGTLNDLAVVGAKPLYVSLSLIIEDGFSKDELTRIVKSISSTAEENNVVIATGDTKVVEKGKADGIFINTTGIGLIEGPELGAYKIKEGDAIIINGPLGEHSITLMLLRNEMELPQGLKSDCTSLYPLIKLILQSEREIHCIRDITRGGLGTILNESISDKPFGIEIEEARIPVSDPVMAFCEILGLDPLYLANEGKFVMFVPSKEAEEIVSMMHQHPLGKNAAIIGKTTSKYPHNVVMTTKIGGKRVINSLVGEQLPRIC